jgi:hypothetical protein
MEYYGDKARQIIETTNKDISCGHDFWDKFPKVGEPVLCNRCHQFFVKIQGQPYFIRRNNEVGVTNVQVFIKVPLQERS